MERQRLYRSADDRWIAGVAAGVADYFDIDPVVVRILWILSVPLTGGLTLLAYIVMIVVVPIEPEDWPEPSPWAPGGEPVGTTGTEPGAAPAAPLTGGTKSSAARSSATAAAATATPPPPNTTAWAAGQPTATGPAWGWQREQERWQRRQERWQMRAEARRQRAERRGGSALIFGLLLVLVGGVLAWKEIFPGFDLSLGWPFVIMIFGAILIASSVGWRERS